MDEENKMPSAPLEYFIQFLLAVTAKNYVKALNYCKIISYFEPHNESVQQFGQMLFDHIEQENRNETAIKLQPSSSTSSTSSLSLETSESSGSSSSSDWSSTNSSDSSNNVSEKEC